MVVLDSVYKSYLDGGQSHPVLQNVDMQIGAGRSAAIVGESGCGKSTLLHLIGALDKPDSGHIQVANYHLEQLTTRQADTYRKVHLGIIFQRFNLIQCLSVKDNITFSMQLNQQHDDARLEELSERLGIRQLWHKMPAHLSGGEQQRVAIARALGHQPALVLADEPTGNLDDKNSDLVSDLLLELCKLHGTTLILVTHSMALAQRCDSRFRLHNGGLTALTE